MTVAEWKTGRGRDALFCEGDEQCPPNPELPGCGLDWWKNNFADCSLQPTHALGNNPTCASIVFSLLLNGVKMWVEVHSIKEKNWEISQKSSTAACPSLSIGDSQTALRRLCGMRPPMLNYRLVVLNARLLYGRWIYVKRKWYMSKALCMMGVFVIILNVNAICIGEAEHELRSTLCVQQHE